MYQYSIMSVLLGKNLIFNKIPPLHPPPDTHSSYRQFSRDESGGGWVGGGDAGLRGRRGVGGRGGGQQRQRLLHVPRVLRQVDNKWQGFRLNIFLWFDKIFPPHFTCSIWSYIFRSSKNIVQRSHLSIFLASTIMLVIRRSREVCSWNRDLARLSRSWFWRYSLTLAWYSWADWIPIPQKVR